MLYIKMSAEGHYEEHEFFSATITPILGDDLLKNGCYDYSLSIQQEARTLKTNGISIHAQNESFKLCENNDSVWIISQDNITPWSNPVTGCYGRAKGDVIAHRLHDTDVVVYEMPKDSWFVSGKTIYHNDGGVLIRYEADNIIGWETWGSLPQRFYGKDAIKFKVNGSYVKIKVNG